MKSSDSVFCRPGRRGAVGSSPLSRSASSEATLRPMGSIIIAVAVLLIHILSMAVAIMNPPTRCRGRVPTGPGVKPGQPGAGQASFGTALNDALKSVSQVQNETTAMIKAYQGGDPSVSLEETMASMQKAQVSFQAALTVRNRLVAAYTDIMNMQV